MTETSGAERNVRLYPYFRMWQNLLFWQAVWFLYFQAELSAAEAILLYVILDLCTTLFEVPSGYMSDRIGRRFTLIAAGATGAAGAALQVYGGTFEVFAMAQVLVGASFAFASGTDSALLYESLAACGRPSRMEQEELRAWRFSFGALAVSAVIGGALALADPAWAYAATAFAFLGSMIVAVRFVEPPPDGVDFAEGREILRLDALGRAFREPVLLWFFALAVVMYVFSHIPFVFGQPFILAALADTGFDAQAPLVSGTVTAIMMVFSVVASLWAAGLRRAIGLAPLVLFAFGMQIALTGILALSNAALVIGLLFLRMVPDALSRPFILARIQPLLPGNARATYLSLQSFLGRLILAGVLFVATFGVSDTAALPYAEMQPILAGFFFGGIGVLLALGFLATRAGIEAD